jgi:hypothetical protein
MAWTAPKTWTVGEILTAANMNIQVRDNLLMTGPALVTTKGDILVAAALNDLRRLGVGADDKIIVAASVEVTGVKWSGSLKLTDTTGNTLVVDTNVLVVDATNNRVGIKIAAPLQALHVEDATAEPIARFSRGPAQYIEIGVDAQAFNNKGAIWFNGVKHLAVFNRGMALGTYSDLAGANQIPAGGLIFPGTLGVGTSDQFGGGATVVGLANAATVPTTNPIGGLVIYAEGGVFKVRQSDGTVKTIGPNDVDTMVEAMIYG